MPRNVAKHPYPGLLRGARQIARYCNCSVRSLYLWSKLYNFPVAYHGNGGMVSDVHSISLWVLQRRELCQSHHIGKLFASPSPLPQSLNRIEQHHEELIPPL